MWGYPTYLPLGGIVASIKLQRWIITCDVFLTLHGGNMPGGVNKFSTLAVGKLCPITEKVITLDNIDYK